MRLSCQSKPMRRGLVPFLAAAPLPQFANEAVARKRMRRGETFPRRQFCQLTVINDFDTLKQADAVFCVSGGGGGPLVIHMFGD